ncbi:flagellar hook-length control protein FliK [Allopusillimonas ginsengisoli]|nr:flagellar hook-length control protein FliK [Allopusillimonas ginsengisoli]
MASSPPPRQGISDGSAQPDLQPENQAQTNAIHTLHAHTTSTGFDDDIDQGCTRVPVRALPSDTQQAVSFALETAAQVVDPGGDTSTHHASPTFAQLPPQTRMLVHASSTPTHAVAFTASGPTDYSGKTKNSANKTHTSTPLVGMRESLRLQAMDKNPDSERTIQALRNTPPPAALSLSATIKQAESNLYTAIERQPARAIASESGKIFTESRELGNAILEMPYLTASGMKSNIGSHNNAYSATEFTINTPISDTHWPSAFSKHFLNIVRSTEHGQQTVELRLDPPELGPLHVSLSVIDNTAQAAFFCTQASVRHAVENALPQLHQLLAQAGISLGQASVNDSHHTGRAFTEESASDGAREHAKESTQTVAMASPSDAGRSRSLDTQIDIYA